MAKGRKKIKISAELRKRDREKPQRRKLALLFILIALVELVIMAYLTHQFIQEGRGFGHYPHGLYASMIGLVLFTGWLIYDWVR